MPAEAGARVSRDYVTGGAQVEMAALSHRASRLVRATSAATGRRAGFGAGEGGVTEVVSARFVFNA